jgi:hypothetical protein
MAVGGGNGGDDGGGGGNCVGGGSLNLRLWSEWSSSVMCECD